MEKPKRRPRKKTKLSLVDEPILSEKNIELLSNDGFDKINLDNKDTDSNSFINKREILNRKFISTNEDKFENLYPSLDDPEFNIKIAVITGHAETNRVYNVISNLNPDAYLLKSKCDATEIGFAVKKMLQNE